MKKVYITVIIFLSLQILVTAQSDSLPERPGIYSVSQGSMAQWVDSISTFWMDSVDIPGMIVSIVSEDSILFQKGYGYINKEHTAKVDPLTSPFRIASISKPFTALATLQLVNEGKLDLHSDVREYTGFEIKRYKNSDITLHHLLTHSTGLDEKILGGGTLDRSIVPNLGPFLSSSMPSQIREPGITFSYSNMGYSLAGYLGELTAEKPFFNYVDDIILDPLDMSNTQYWRGDEEIYSESKSYFLDDNGFREYPPYEIKSYPSGSMISTADDMSRFMIMILNNGWYKGKQVVSPEVIKMLCQPVFTQDERLRGARSYGFFNWDINGVKFLSHGGSIEGYRSMLYIFPELKVGMFISTNSSWGSWSNSEIGRSFRIDWLKTSETTIDTATSQGIPANASDITGSYFTTRSPNNSIMKVGRLANWAMDVKFDEDGYLYFAGDPSVLYAETEPMVYTVKNQNRNVANKIIFKGNEEVGIEYMFTSGFNAYFKLKWWETNNVQLPYVMIIFGIFLIFILYNLITFIRRKIKGNNTISSKVYNSSTVATLFHVITFLTIGFYLYVSDGLVFDFGLPWFLKILMLLPIIALVLTVFSVFGSRSVFQDNHISIFKKSIFLLNLSSLILIVPFLYYWNLLGFNF